jgi:hypothetical protein
MPRSLMTKVGTVTELGTIGASMTVPPAATSATGHVLIAVPYQDSTATNYLRLIQQCTPAR